MKFALTVFLSLWSLACIGAMDGGRLQPASVADNWRWNELVSLHPYQIKSGTGDANGDLWFVHADGLIKYDGVEIESFPTETFFLENATDLFVSESGLVAILSDSALHLWQEGQFTTHDEFSYSLGSRNAVAEDEKGRIYTINWVKGELVTIDENGLHPIDIRLDQPTSILIDANSNLWVVESGKKEVSVFELKESGDSLEVELLHTIPCNPKNQYYTRLLEDSEGRVWVIDPDKEDQCFYYVDYQRHPGFSGLKEAGLWGEALNVVETDSGNILFCVSRRLGLLDDHQLTILNIQELPIPSSSPYMRVLASGKLLIGGQNLNPYLIDLSTNRWRTYLGVNFQCEDTDGNNWFLSYDRKAVVEHAGTWTEYGVESGIIDTPNRIIAGSDGSVWASGSHGGKAAVSWFYQGKWNRQAFSNASTTFSHLAVLEIGTGQFAFGCGTPIPELEGLVGGGVIFEKHGDRYQGTHFPPPAFIPRTATLALREQDGLYMGEGYIARGFSGLEPFANDMKVFHRQWIDHMIVDSRNNLWVACLGIGVYQYDGDNWRLHGPDTGLTNPNVIYLLEDTAQGGILALTEQGFVYFDGSRWRDWEFNSDVPFRRENHTLVRDNNGAIWINYATRGWFLEGEKIREPSIHFKTIRYFPDSQSPETSASLTQDKFPEGSQVYVKFDGVDPWDETPAEDLMFSWKLNEGDWSVFTSGFQTVLNHLESGAYRIEIRARDMEGNVDSSPASLAFTIVPPLWQNPMFVLFLFVLIVLVCALAYSLFRVRVQAAVAMETFKLDFFTNISHELRNPLAVILTPIERLLKDEADQDKRTNLNIVLRNARKMQGMVDQLLQFRKLQANKWEVHATTGEIISFVQDCVGNLKPLWEAKRQRLELSTHPESCICAFDADIIQTVIDNLLSNAVKYSDEGTRILVRASLRHIDTVQELTLQVEDEGSSISAHEKENILAPFYRINNQAGEMGTGIGLALVDQLVKLCGGNLDIESPLTSEGRGSRFTVILPLDVPGERLADRHHAVPDSDSDPSGTTILVVEDNADFRHVIVQELSAVYNVVEAVDGEDGFDRALEVDPALIVSDVIMPKLDGYELCDRLKSNSETSHIPIILLTAKSADEHRIKGLEVGADAYISKPLKFDHLAAHIKNLLNSRHELRQRFSHHVVVQPSEVTVTPTDERILEKAIRVVDENMIEEDFDVQQFSRLMGMSKSSLVRKLKAITGLTPLHFVQSMRLKRAAVLLKGGMSVSEAAAQVGMYNMSYFSKLFRKEFGVVPSEYKNTG